VASVHATMASVASPAADSRGKVRFMDLLQ
jgi:hypothetical protein